MNCQEINQLLDADTDDLTGTQRESVDRHLASCHACSEDWANWREVAALQIPATPAALRGRIAVALPVQLAAPARRSFRPYVVGGVLLACAAAAAMLVTQYAQRGQGPAAAAAGASQMVAPVVREDEGSATTGPAPGLAPPLGGGMAAKADKPAAITADVPMNPHRILVLRRPEVAADTPALALAERCYRAIVTELRAAGGVEIATDEAVHTNASLEDLIRLPERDRRIARGIGAGKVLAITTMNGCRATLYDSQSGAMDQGAGGGGVDAQGDRVDGFAKSMALSVRQKTLHSGETLLAQARAAVLDTSLSDLERISALWMPLRLSPGQDAKGLRSFFDKEIVAAAADIVSRSPDARVREGVWAGLRGIDDPVLVPPLLNALANDPERSVRYQVALDLHAFLDQPGVPAALQRAAAEDPEKDPERIDSFTVREAAQRALIADKDFRNWVRATLFDESLPARWRLLNLNDSPDGRIAMLPNYGKDAARVVFDIGRREQDPKVRALAWDVLRVDPAPDESFVPVLLGDLASHPDENVRAYAAQILGRHIGKPEVHAALERAHDDSSMAVRREADMAMKQPGR